MQKRKKFISFFPKATVASFITYKFTTIQRHMQTSGWKLNKNYICLFFSGEYVNLCILKLFQSSHKKKALPREPKSSL